MVCYFRIDFLKIITGSVMYHLSYAVGPKVNFPKFILRHYSCARNLNSMMSFKQLIHFRETGAAPENTSTL